MDYELLLPFGGLLIGCALRTLLPYAITGLELCRDAKTWTVWPKFDASYLASFALAAILYTVGLLTIPGAWGWTLELALVPSISVAYTAQSLARLGVKATKPKQSNPD